MEIFKDSIFDSVLIYENTVFIRENASQRKPYSLILSLYVKIRVRENRILWFYLYTWKYGSEKTVFFDSFLIRENTGQTTAYSSMFYTAPHCEKSPNFMDFSDHYTLGKKSPYSELFWSAFFPHLPAFGLNTERFVVGKCGKNSDQNNFEYGLFLRSHIFCEDSMI